MERYNLGYSTKNVPVAKHSEYLKCLIEKTELFLRRMRWKAFFFLNPNIKPSAKETFGFNTTKSPKPIPELKDFEDKMLHLVQNIKFKKFNCQFQNKLISDTGNIKKDEKLYVSADKTSNFYKVDPSDYEKLLQNNITKSYRKAPQDAMSTIITHEKHIANDLELADRINTTAKKDAYITLKDHKANFRNNPSCRLINPAKSDIGQISKQILERINRKIMAKSKLNQWKSTNDVLKWYNNIPNKQMHSFICFDIVEFYPSISEELLLKALEFGSKFDTIEDYEKNIILKAKQSLLFNGSESWCKKNTNSLFDVTMGSWDGAETCELVGSFLLSELPAAYRSQIGLYRDDGLAAFNKTPREIECIKKDICKTFGNHNLKITIEANKKVVDYLDVTLDLRSGTFMPFMKPNNTPTYVHYRSNHPPSIIRNIPEAINRRLSNISSDEKSFTDAIPPYQAALQKSGYKPSPQIQSIHFEERQPKEKT